MPVAPRRYSIVAAKRLPAVVACYKHSIVVPRPLPAAPFLVHRRYLIVVSRPLPAAPLAVLRTYLIVALRPDEQRIGGHITSFICTEAKVTLAAMYLRRGEVAGQSFRRSYVTEVPRFVPIPLPAATRRSRSRRRSLAR
jgi:hypothetical protein